MGHPNRRPLSQRESAGLILKEVRDRTLHVLDAYQQLHITPLEHRLAVLEWRLLPFWKRWFTAKPVRKADAQSGYSAPESEVVNEQGQ